MILLGLTGGVGMGKTTVANLLEQRGWPVVDSDLIARQIVEPGQPALAEIAAQFGGEMISPEGRLRRDLLAERVFSDEAERKKIEAILHPRIRQTWRGVADQWRKEGRPGGVAVIPLLYEVGADEEFVRVLCVACSAATQRKRLEARGWTPGEIERRQRAQWPVDKKMARANFVVWSEGGLDATVAQLDRVLAAL
jgi:dephospho-CoA kinase